MPGGVLLTRPTEGRRDVAAGGHANGNALHECCALLREKVCIFILFYFFVGRRLPSLIKSRMTLGRHLVLIRATNAAESSLPPPPPLLPPLRYGRKIFSRPLRSLDRGGVVAGTLVHASRLCARTHTI